MNFQVNRKLENKVFTTEVKFQSYGATDLTPEDEKTLINDFGAPTINVGATYTGKFIVEGGKLKEDEVDGEEVKFVINSNKVEVKEGFVVAYTIDSKKIPATEPGAEYLKTTQLVAEARCLVFEAAIKQKLEEAIAELRAKETTFEKDAPKEFTI